jgi:hypothetical protein
MCGSEKFKEIEKEAIMTHKRCSTPGCEKQAVKDGLCTKCYRKKHGHGPYEKKDNKPAQPKKERKINIKVKGNVIDQGKLAGAIAGAIKVNEHTVTIDFSDHMDLHRVIEKKAKEEFRTVSGQILFCMNAIHE